MELWMPSNGTVDAIKNVDSCRKQLSDTQALRPKDVRMNQPAKTHTHHGSQFCST